MCVQVEKEKKKYRRLGWIDHHKKHEKHLLRPEFGLPENPPKYSQYIFVQDILLLYILCMYEHSLGLNRHVNGPPTAIASNPHINPH